MNVSVSSRSRGKSERSCLGLVSNKLSNVSVSKEKVSFASLSNAMWLSRSKVRSNVTNFQPLLVFTMGRIPTKLHRFPTSSFRDFMRTDRQTDKHRRRQKQYLAQHSRRAGTNFPRLLHGDTRTRLDPMTLRSQMAQLAIPPRILLCNLIRQCKAVSITFSRPTATHSTDCDTSGDTSTSQNSQT